MKYLSNLVTLLYLTTFVVSGCEIFTTNWMPDFSQFRMPEFPTVPADSTSHLNILGIEDDTTEVIAGEVGTNRFAYCVTQGRETRIMLVSSDTTVMKSGSVLSMELDEVTALCPGDKRGYAGIASLLGIRDGSGNIKIKIELVGDTAQTSSSFGVKVSGTP